MTLQELFGEEYEYNYFSYYEMPENFKNVEEKLHSYDDGDWITRYIIKNKKTEKFYSIYQEEDSWEGYHSFPLIIECVPKEITKVEYFDV